MGCSLGSAILGGCLVFMFVDKEGKSRREEHTHIPGHEASGLKLLDRHPTPLREEEHVPVLVSHGNDVAVDRSLLTILSQCRKD